MWKKKKSEKILNISPDRLLAPERPLRDDPDRSFGALVRSVRLWGILEPVLVAPANKNYRVICGARRVAAAKALSLSAVPCRVLNAPDRDLTELALAENLFRKDLSPFEEAAALDAVLRRKKEPEEQLAARLGRAPSAVFHARRLLRLSREEKRVARRYSIAPEKILPLLQLPAGKERLRALRLVGREELSAEDCRLLAEKLSESSFDPGDFSQTSERTRSAAPENNAPDFDNKSPASRFFDSADEALAPEENATAFDPALHSDRRRSAAGESAPAFAALESTNRGKTLSESACKNTSESACKSTSESADDAAVFEAARICAAGLYKAPERAAKTAPKRSADPLLPVGAAKSDPEGPVRRLVVGDVRLFVNSVDRAIESIREAGFSVEANKEDGPGAITYTIRIPKAARRL